jgi:DNA-binding MurR/RpiR family transcriptional regulator
MMKILTTQIGGLLQRAGSNNEEAVEETARLLAQATIGEGRVIFAGFDEMAAVGLNAQFGAEPFKGAHPFEEGMEIHSADRVWLFTRSAADTRALELARLLARKFIPFAVVTSEKATEDNELADLAYTYMATGFLKGILPGEDIGSRIVQPNLLVALFLYEAVKMAYDEMVSDEE